MAILINCMKSAFTNRTSTMKKYGFVYASDKLQEDSLFIRSNALRMHNSSVCICYRRYIIWLEGGFVHIASSALVSIFGIWIYICINKHERTHMYLSRLFILFHFNIAIDVIAVVGICLFVSFSPLWIFQFMRNWCWCASVRNVKVMLYYKSFQCCFFSIGVQHPENSPSAFRQTTAAMVPMLIRRWQCADNEIYIQMNWCKVIQIWNFCFRCYTKLNRHHRNYAKIHFKAANM